MDGLWGTGDNQGFPHNPGNYVSATCGPQACTAHTVTPSPTRENAPLSTIHSTYYHHYRNRTSHGVVNTTARTTNNSL